MIGFTLIELLVVLAIIAVILALVVPAVAPLIRSSNMNKASAMVTDELNLARQIALTQNRDVEVRFYLLPSKSDLNDKRYRAFRSFAAVGSRSVKTPLSPVKYLPEPVIISTDKDSGGNILSTLLDFGNSNRSGLTTGMEDLPGAPGTFYVSFLFRPTGGTNLTPVDPAAGGNWYLTIYAENAPKSPTLGMPNNYFTAQIDPVTGRVRTYRP